MRLSGFVMMYEKGMAKAERTLSFKRRKCWNHMIVALLRTRRSEPHRVELSQTNLWPGRYIIFKNASVAM